MPALALAQKSWRRAQDSGVAPEAPRPAAPVSSPEALGEQLLALALLAEQQGWDAEAALRAQIRTMHAEIASIESASHQRDA